MNNSAYIRFFRSHSLFAKLAGVCGIVLAVEIIWFGMLYPLWPDTFAGWLLASLCGLLVALWAGLNIALLNSLQKLKRHLVFFKAIGVIVAISLGLGIFAACYAERRFMQGNFSYFGKNISK